MALRTIGTSTTTSLPCLTSWSSTITAADLANIANAITDDSIFGAILAFPGSGVKAVLTTGSTHASTTLDTLAAVSGPGLSQIAVGDLVLGIGIVPGTYVSRILSGTSVLLSQATTGNSAGVRVAFARATATLPGDLSANSLLVVPNRGILKVLQGDIVAIDNIGSPYLIPGNAVGYAGSQWVLT